MSIRKLLLALILFGALSSLAAPFKNVEKILTQPDGTKLYCYASGDEFYNRLHDIDGFTIVQAENGYFVYATTDAKGEIIASQHIAGKSNPKALGLTPNISISQKEYHKKREKMETTKFRGEGLNHGTYNNIVVFIKFNGDDDMTTTKNRMESMLNGNGYYDISMNNYFKKMTYNKLSMVSYSYPMSEGNKIVAYEDVYPRNYYTPYNAVTNPDGYKEEERGTREFALLKRAIESIADQVPDTLNIDRNNDGLVDNVIFVVKGNTGDWSDLLWPHMWSLHGEEVFIRNKRVMTFNFQLETSTYFTVSTLCHEMAHSLGLPDLYHYEEWYSDLSPVGSWDLMCTNSEPPQHTSTYMKYKYGTWIDEIPEIGYGTYTIEANSWEGGRRNCFKIPSSDPEQYYLIEYRNKDNIFEKGLPSGGLLIYRVDPRFNGCVDFNAEDILDELYIYRPGGSLKTNGKLTGAAFCKERDKTEFNHTTDPYPFLNFGGTDMNINICNISEIGNQMTFSYYPINSEMIPINFTINVNKNKAVELKWDTVDGADSYNIYRDGTLIASNVKDTYFNDDYKNITNGYHTYYVTSNFQNEESFHSDEKSVIIGDYCEYVFKMNSSGENGWQGGEIKLSFDNGMKDTYLTVYSGAESVKSVMVPTGIKMSVYWNSGWDDKECSFIITNGDQEIYTSNDLKEGLLTNINTDGDRCCVQPENLTAELSDNHVFLNWCASVECDYYAIMRNGEIIADNITSNSYVDKSIEHSGTHAYSVVSKKQDCTSEPSKKACVSVIKYNNNMIDGTASQKNNQVCLNWNINTKDNSSLNYDNDEYVTNIGNNSNTWGIKIPVEQLKKFKDAKITAVEIFDASTAKYTFNIHNGDNPNNSNLIHTEVFNTTETYQFVTLPLSKELSFDIEKDLWVTVKASNSSNKPIPCCEFVGSPNSNMIKVGNSFKTASDYDMDYSWMLRVLVNMSEELPNEFSYNVYRQDSLLASNLKSTTYTDNNIISGDVCYNIEVVYDNNRILYSNDMCLTVDVDEIQYDELVKVAPNPTKDYINITTNGIKNVKIISINGNVVFDRNYDCDALEIDMREFGGGIYLIQIVTESEVKTQKVIVE